MIRGEGFFGLGEKLTLRMVHGDKGRVCQENVERKKVPDRGKNSSKLEKKRALFFQGGCGMGHSKERYC